MSAEADDPLLLIHDAPLHAERLIELVLALRDEVRALRAELDALAATVDRARPVVDVGLLGVFMAATFEFVKGEPWGASDLIADARRAQWRALSTVLDSIAGDSGKPAIALGRWLERRVGIEVDGLRLVRAHRQSKTWCYRIEQAGE